MMLGLFALALAGLGPADGAREAPDVLFVLAILLQIRLEVFAAVLRLLPVLEVFDQGLGPQDDLKVAGEETAIASSGDARSSQGPHVLRHLLRPVRGDPDLLALPTIGVGVATAFAVALCDVAADTAGRSRGVGALFEQAGGVEPLAIVRAVDLFLGRIVVPSAKAMTGKTLRSSNGQKNVMLLMMATGCSQDSSPLRRRAIRAGSSSC